MPLLSQSIIKLLHLAIYGPVQEILVLIAYVEMSLTNAYADIFSKARDLNFSQSLHLHLHFVHVSSGGTCESGRGE